MRQETTVHDGAAAEETGAGTTPDISFNHVGKRFFKKGKPFQALGDAHFDVQPGEFLSIVGPSGCGKSTLLNITAGLMKPSSGDVRYKGEPVTEVNTDVGYMTQADTLLPWRTVRQNIAVPLEIRHSPRAERGDRIDEMVEKVGLKEFGNHYPAELSGGMRKRVLLARTLIYQPETLLMDEPFGALDAQLKLVLQQELLRLWAEAGTTIMFVTHDLAEAVTLSDRVVVVSSRPGTMRTIKTIDIPRPRAVFDVRFNDRFRELQQELWAILQDDMMEGGEM
ncbi:ABC transporter ATP-binding protein [Actinophytocola oryzae]|uniref:NitT/TauT family transport system ATP-binding protein n=1 Tax=Actinophytocola oryzae TaxID=502181 RepID=A0A4R7W422_9PSEU|nr:ABC transporter ATP-binding protein [Actinophytocola oryzae]TDV56367.1 NitT/TauT family transport system ATP-binding protein [Actinophytocola oryzae]